MKAMRFVLILIVVFTFVSPVHAQAGTRYGFIPLVTKAKTDLPLWVQSQQAFERWLPRLMAAKQKGEILEFEPEFGLGVLKIKYVAGAKGLIFGREIIFDDIQEAVALTPREQLTDVQPEVYTPVFNMTLWQDCVNSIVGPNSHVVATVQNQVGKTLIKYEYETGPTGSGFDTYCFRDSKVPDLRFQPGYKLTYKIYSTKTGVLRGTYQTVIPDVKITRFDKKNSLVIGTGPANKPYSLEWSHYNLDENNTRLKVTKKSAIAANGTWQIDFGTTPIRGGDWFDITVKQNANFVFNRYLVAPYVYCEISSNYCISHGIPFNRASVTITHPGLTRTFEGRYDEFGSFKVELLDDMDKRIPLVAGDQIFSQGVTTYTLPRFDLTRVPGMQTVSGFGPANKYVRVGYWWGIYYFDDVTASDWLLTNADGSYTSNDLSDVEESFTFLLTYKDSSSGNVTERYDPYMPPP